MKTFSGCKGFFRRTVRFQRKYECSFDKNCIIRKEFRNCCRACRYDKCLKMGLNPLMVHSDRVASSTKNSSSEPEASTSVVVKIESNYDDEEDEIESKAVVKKDMKNFHSKNNYFEDDVEDEYAHWHQLIVASSSRL
uniref:Nuclear receptor domain-containing protein n=1 Tax=Panagrolaimus sp. PS1159 TaxID=55785 RepID=A0AC35GHU3_9BILA